MEVSGKNIIGEALYFLYAVSAHFQSTFELQTHGRDNAHNRMLLCIDGGMQADKEGQCMQRRGGSVQCFALE